MNLDIEIALWAIGMRDVRMLPSIALQAHSDGLDGPALNALSRAGNFQPADADKLLRQAVMEMKKTFPTKEQAESFLALKKMEGLTIAKQIAKDILNGETTPYEGARKIWWNVWNDYGRLEELTEFVGLADDYEDHELDGQRNQICNEIITAAKKLASHSPDFPTHG